MPELSRVHGERINTERKEWTLAEDEIIRTSVQMYGCRWRRIAALLPGRSDDAVRNRWNRLKSDKPRDSKYFSRADSPVLTHAPATGMRKGADKPERVSWTRVEDETIMQSVAELGHKWNKLTDRLPGRTDHAIRNRFHRLQSMMADGKTQPPLSVQKQPNPAMREVGTLPKHSSSSSRELIGVPEMAFTNLLAVA